MVIGITGTRDGMTSEQKSIVHKVLSFYFFIFILSFTLRHYM